MFFLKINGNQFKLKAVTLIIHYYLSNKMSFKLQL